MSVDCIIHGVPERIPAAHVAAMLVQWCGSDIAALHTDPLHVALRGESQCDEPWRRGPRVIEVYRPSPRVLWLTLRLADVDARKPLGFPMIARKIAGDPCNAYRTV